MKTRSTLCKLSLARLLMAAALLLSAPVSAQGLAADTPSQTVNGNPFTAPKDWTLDLKGQATILTPPEGGSHLVLFDASAGDADAAVAQAWTAYGAKTTWPLRQTTDLPAQHGWDQGRTYDYETSANDHRLVQAVALRKDKAWTVALIDFDYGLLEKRGAQLSLVRGSWLPKGEAKESFAGKTAHKLDAARLQALKDFIVESQKELDVPGVALGIVQDDKVLFSGGFGVRELGKPDKVDSDTRFLIASNTKALTTLLLARLVEQGKFRWDTPVTQVYPAFRLGDADTTRQVLMRHLVCACTGLPRQDMEWWYEGEKNTPESTMATLATMQPTSKFGELFQYSNLMAAAAGFIGGHVLYPELELGAAYDKAIQQQVFDLLGMKSTTFDYAKALRGNHAWPHAEDVDGNVVRADNATNYTIIAARPAGAAWSNVNDLLKYVRMELDEGLLPDGKRYIGKDALLERRRKQVSVGDNIDYGMGLIVDRTWGVPVVQHGGSMIGFKTDMYWIPDAGVGAVVLTNADEGYYIVRQAFARRLLEILYDGKPEAAASVAAQAKSNKAAYAIERKRLAVPADAAAAAKLAAHYRNAALGDLLVTRREGRTWFDFGSFKSEVASRANDDGSLSFVTITSGDAGSEFVVADKDGARKLVIRDGQHEYVFDEVGR